MTAADNPQRGWHQKEGITDRANLCSLRIARPLEVARLAMCDSLESLGVGLLDRDSDSGARELFLHVRFTPGDFPALSVQEQCQQAIRDP